MIRGHGRLAAALAVAFVVLSLAAQASAAVPSVITQQGRLFDAVSGDPVTGSKVISFAIYPVATGGTAIWTESQTVSFDEGYFSVQLGSVTPFPPSMFASATGPLYVGVKIDDDPDELSPRPPIASVPYALVADDAIGAIHPTEIFLGTTPLVDAAGNLDANTVSVNGVPVIDASGNWVGPSIGTGSPQYFNVSGSYHFSGISGTRYFGICGRKMDALNDNFQFHSRKLSILVISSSGTTTPYHQGYDIQSGTSAITTTTFAFNSATSGSTPPSLSIPSGSTVVVNFDLTAYSTGGGNGVVYGEATPCHTTSPSVAPTTAGFEGRTRFRYVAAPTH